MRHKNYDMIVAKAANMDLVLFKNNCDGRDWYEEDELPVSESEFVDYFLCLPQHKEACLYWLNGGHVQWGCTEHEEFDWYDKDTIGINSIEEDAKYFLCPTMKVRIAPRKEKRWIAFKWDNYYVIPRHYDTKESAESAATASMMGEFQFIEIEIEV